MSRNNPTVTVIINTCNRGKYLGNTLEGLKQQTYENFEVVLVNGPSVDNTEEVAKRYNVRYYEAPFNISISRNIGIKNAAGEILAFIDDDAVPEPEWIEDLTAAYVDENVGAAGGFVYNADGSGFQFKYGMIDMWGYPSTRETEPYKYNEPNVGLYNINIGTNASYRRSCLIEVGGFDEEIEYYHDESDVCVRIINAGYKVAQLDNAFVHHKMAPSFRRTSSTRVTNWDAIVKNTIYFGLKHSEGNAGILKRLFVFPPKEFKKFVGMFRILLSGEYTVTEYVIRNLSLVRAFARGYKRGFFQERKLLTNYTYKPNEFKKFVSNSNKNKKNVIIVTQGFPPAAQDGITRYSHTLAEGLARVGDRVFVVTKSITKQKSINFNGRYWVYSYVEESITQSTGVGRTDKLMTHAEAVYKTVKSITSKSRPDVVVAPMFDIEGIGCILDKEFPVITTIMTPLKKVVETQWSWLEDPSLETVYDLERATIEGADGVMAISAAIKDTLQDMYGIDWKEYQKNGGIVAVLPLGVESVVVGKYVRSDNYVRLLYVGRFERRKGIDLLLDVLPELMSKYPELTVELVGDPDILNEDGKKYYSEFKRFNKKQPWFNRINMRGLIDEMSLAGAYEECDFMVAPSRYESFGLIYIEAMSRSKPVIGPNIGGVPETIIDGKNGYLFEAGNSIDLLASIEKMISNKKLRIKMGKNALTTVESKFTTEIMVNNFKNLLARLNK